MTATVELRFRPPTRPWSVNERLHWTERSRRARAWRAAACAAAQRQLGIGATLPLSVVEVHIPFARGARRDPHNYSSTVLKHVVDGLGPPIVTRRNGKATVHPGAHLWPDDTPEFVTTREPVLYVGDEVIVHIWTRQDLAAA